MPVNFFSNRPPCSFRRTSSCVTKSGCFLEKRSLGSLVIGISGAENQPYLDTYDPSFSLPAYLILVNLLHVNRRWSKRIEILGCHLLSFDQINVVLSNIPRWDHVVFRIEFAGQRFRSNSRRKCFSHTCRNPQFVLPLVSLFVKTQFDRIHQQISRHNFRGSRLTKSL